MPSFSQFNIDTEHIGATVTLDGTTITAVDFISNKNNSNSSSHKSVDWTLTPLANVEQVLS